MNQDQASFTIPVLISGHNPKAKKPTVAEQLLAWYQANSLGGEFGIIIKQAGLLKQIVAYENDRRAARATKNHPHKRIFDIEPLPGLVHHMRMEPKRVRIGRRHTLQFGALQGTFRILVTDSLPIFIVSWGITPKEMGEMAIGSQKAFDLLFERLETKRRRLITSAPPKGIWDVLIERISGQDITHFVKKRFDVENTLRFCGHPMYDALERDMEDFFANIAWWTRYNQPGMRKVLLSGPPGTGKTSIAMALAARKQRPTLIIAEEVDMLKRPSGAVLNWLDGSDTPRNPAGTYLIVTTNYPRKIDPRILKRPGRIDHALRVGALRTKDAAAIAQSFLGEDARAIDLKALGQALDRTTPAEIREIINGAIRGLAPGKPLDIDAIANSRSGLKRRLAEIEDSGDDDPDSREDIHRRLGPIDDDYEVVAGEE